MTTTIHFLPDDIKIEAQDKENVLAAAARAGVYINAYCGGDGTCGKCKIVVQEGETRAQKSQHIKEDDFSKGMRLACQCEPLTDIVVQIPAEIGKEGRALKRRPKTTRAISSSAVDELVGKWEMDPPVEKRFLKLTPPTMEDNLPDLQRLLRAITGGGTHAKEPTYDHPQMLQDLPFILREADWEVTVILLRGKREREPDRIISVEPGDTTKNLYGLALDIGTTTVSGLLLDLNTGEILAESSVYNAQISYGEDVISRIVYSQRRGGLHMLQERVIYTINEIIQSICKDMIISPSDISYIMASGNTVMAHLLIGIDPKFLREAPYVPVCSQFPLTVASDLGVMAHPSVRLFQYPAIASYVGGDIVSGVHACQIHKSSAITLFIDIGTNGEIVVGNQDWLMCAACSAGPAFEGGGITHGMRAGSGGIENCHIHPETYEPMIVTINQDKPVGICGSGLISIVSELMEVGIVDQQGKFPRNIDHPRIREGRDGYEYVLVWKDSAQGDDDIVITEVDLDNLIRAKGAMFAGYQTLLEAVGLGFVDLDRVVIAGNFGAYIDLERAINIGLLPDIARDKFHYLGNGSLLGTRISLCDNKRFRERVMVRPLMTNIELSENIEFMNHY
ncbi:MAG: ASKHA domain-containing protein, partial [Desulfurivibrionaceae bacterium]